MRVNVAIEVIENREDVEQVKVCVRLDRLPWLWWGWLSAVILCKLLCKPTRLHARTTF